MCRGGEEWLKNRFGEFQGSVVRVLSTVFSHSCRVAVLGMMKTALGAGLLTFSHRRPQVSPEPGVVCRVPETFGQPVCGVRLTVYGTEL
jgi:hypothetical protein